MAMPTWVKNATTARKRVIHQSVLGSVRKKAIIRANLMESLHTPTSTKNTRTDGELIAVASSQQAVE